MNQIRDYYEYLLSRSYWLQYQFLSVIGSILLFIMPIMFGKTIVEVYRQITTSINIWTFKVWTPHWPVLAILFFWLLGFIFKKYTQRKANISRELYNAVRWACQDIGTRDNLTQDIRCTIWIPIGNQRLSETKLRLLQVIPYFPLTSTLFNLKDKPVDAIRKNGNHLRTFKVAKKMSINKKSTIQPIGILGITACRCISGSYPKIVKETLDKNDNIMDHLIKKRHFSEFQASKLTPDRKAYLCLPIVSNNKEELLGIVYFDSKKTRAFNDEFTDSFMKYLQRFATIIVQQ